MIKVIKSFLDSLISLLAYIPPKFFNNKLFWYFVAVIIFLCAVATCVFSYFFI